MRGKHVANVRRLGQKIYANIVAKVYVHERNAATYFHIKTTTSLLFAIPVRMKLKTILF